MHRYKKNYYIKYVRICTLKSDFKQLRINANNVIEDKKYKKYIQLLKGNELDSIFPLKLLKLLDGLCHLMNPLVVIFLMMCSTCFQL